MDKSDLRIEQLQQYLDKKKGVVESDIKEYNLSLIHISEPTRH